jgi:hypothetical protein
MDLTITEDDLLMEDRHMEDLHMEDRRMEGHNMDAHNIDHRPLRIELIKQKLVRNLEPYETLINFIFVFVH